MQNVLKIILCLGIICFLFLILKNDTIYAVEDPLETPNNKIGIHLLFPSEIKEASLLVNSQGGSWGYVTIPIQATDKNLKKWQKFMDDAKKYQIIPIIRIATEGDYFNKTVWRKPGYEDILDFANFLNSLDWPTKNRYVIIFNEPNNQGEWGGDVSPKEYAELLSYAVTVFKSVCQDFFIISAGLDNAAANNDGQSMKEYDFLWQMHSAVPGIFNQIDGMSSHSYPNPGFKSKPSSSSKMGIRSFEFESNLIESLSHKSLPIFITETGWSNEDLSEKLIAAYYKEALENAWNSPKIVAITPFLFKAHAGPFMRFSFLRNNDGELFEYAKFFQNLPKTSGQPLLNQTVLGEQITTFRDLPTKKFETDRSSLSPIKISSGLKTFLKWLLKID